MLDNIFSSVLSSSADSFDAKTFLLCTLISIIMGVVIAVAYTFKNNYTKSFVVTLALIPAVVQVIIMLVNGNLGTGIAVMGAFGLVRFRSAPGSAKEICSIMIAMAVGLASGTGSIGVAVFIGILLSALLCLYSSIKIGSVKENTKDLQITIPESLDYTGLFDDLFEKYTVSNNLYKVKTSNMGSLYRLYYYIELKDAAKEKEFLDAVRCRNGNLDIVCGKVNTNMETL